MLDSSIFPSNFSQTTCETKYNSSQKQSLESPVHTPIPLK